MASHTFSASLKVKKIVSRETFFLLSRYATILLQWNKSLNLTSKRSTIETVWGHILDSLLLSRHIDDKSGVIVDVGSGAGLPGMVLAINNYDNCILVEINQKKVAFLRFIAAELNIKVTVLDCCITKCNLTADYIVSRAMTSISKLIKMTKDICSHNTQYLLHIGKDYKHDIALLRKQWSFELQEYINTYRSNCKIIAIKNFKSERAI